MSHRNQNQNKDIQSRQSRPQQRHAPQQPRIVDERILDGVHEMSETTQLHVNARQCVRQQDQMVNALNHGANLMHTGYGVAARFNPNLDTDTNVQQANNRIQIVHGVIGRLNDYGRDVALAKVAAKASGQPQFTMGPSVRDRYRSATSTPAASGAVQYLAPTPAAGPLQSLASGQWQQ